MVLSHRRLSTFRAFILFSLKCDVHVLHALLHVRRANHVRYAFSVFDGLHVLIVPLNDAKPILNRSAYPLPSIIMIDCIIK